MLVATFPANIKPGPGRVNDWRKVGNAVVASGADASFVFRAAVVGRVEIALLIGHHGKSASLASRLEFRERLMSTLEQKGVIHRMAAAASSATLETVRSGLASAALTAPTPGGPRDGSPIRRRGRELERGSRRGRCFGRYAGHDGRERGCDSGPTRRVSERACRLGLVTCSPFSERI